MGLRFRKRVKIAPGLHLNFSLKRGLSASIGPKGASHNIGLDGRRRTTVTVPGTGVSHVTEHAQPIRGNPWRGALFLVLLVAFAVAWLLIAV